LEIENLLCHPQKHSRKKSFQRHFEKKILKPKLALTFNKKMEIKDLKHRYARTGKNKKNSKRIFNGRNLKSNNINKKSEHRDLFKLTGSKPYIINKKSSSKMTKKNISSGKKMLDMFASQTLNPLKNELKNLQEKNKRHKQKQFLQNPKSKFSNRKVFRKPSSSNPIGLPYKPKKAIFLELNMIRKGSWKKKKDFRSY